MLYILLAGFVRPWYGGFYADNLKRMRNVLTSVTWRFARQLHPQNMHSFDCSNLTFWLCVSFPQKPSTAWENQYRICSAASRSCR